VSGQLTWRTSRRLHASFRRVVDEGGRELRVDLRSVSEADPAGVAVLLVYARLLPTLGGTLEVSGASAPCHALLQRMQLSHLLDQPPATDDGPGGSLRRQATDAPRPRQDGCSALSAAALEGAR
jgi:ABC-type transporter Mla MlaB component